MDSFTPENEVCSSSRREKAVRLPALSDYCAIKKLLHLIVGTNAVDDDISRWLSQGFTFSQNPNFGLKQGSGGPCGVLAAVQGGILKNLFDPNIIPTNDEGYEFTSSMVKESLIKALWEILNRCRSREHVYLIDSSNPDLFSLYHCDDLTVRELSSESSFTDAFQDMWSSYGSGCGCLLFVLSLVVTRGLQELREDMDDTESSLIGQFGHCTQELMNLLLTGRASSNVFDGEVPMAGTGDDQLMLRGVLSRPPIGYLSQLECLRYCEVGSFYKVPERSIWVVGSATHFTVLFSLDRRVNEESSDEQLLSRVQRAFKAVDSDGCGFIMDTQLEAILTTLDVPFAADPAEVVRFKDLIQLDGGIILWSSFWEKVSRVLTGSSVDELFTDDSPLQNSSRPRSDSDIAREMQAEFDRPAKSSAEEEKNPRNEVQRSDSDLARQLQEEWNSSPMEQADTLRESSNTSSVANSDSSVKPSSRIRHRSDSIAGVDDDSFVMYHYNGFGGPDNTSKLSKFVLYRRAADESVGQSVSMSTAETTAYGGADICPIEEVMRTRWKGCRLDFLGKPPPSLD